MYNTNKDRVLDYMENYGFITCKIAGDRLGIYSLSSVIHSLRKEYDITSEYVTGKNRWGRTVRFVKYKLI